MRARGIRRRHAADRAERRARRTHRESQPFQARDALHLAADRARLHDEAPLFDSRFIHVLPSRQVDDDVRPNRRAGHAAARSTRNQPGALAPGPFEKRHEIFDVFRRRDGGGENALNARALGVDRPRVEIVAEDSAKAFNGALEGHSPPR